MARLPLKHISKVLLGLSLFAETVSKAGTPAISAHLNSLLFSELQRKADQGNVKAQIELGARYETGNGLPQNTQAAEKYLKQAAEQGNEDAEYNLGLLYYQGKNISPNFKKAHDYFIKAAAQGNPEANRARGIMSAKGDFVPKDPQKAQLYKPAKKGWKGHAPTLKNLIETVFTRCMRISWQMALTTWSAAPTCKKHCQDRKVKPHMRDSIFCPFKNFRSSFTSENDLYF